MHSGHLPGSGNRVWVDGYDLGVGKRTAQTFAHQGARQVHVGGKHSLAGYLSRTLCTAYWAANCVIGTGHDNLPYLAFALLLDFLAAAASARSDANWAKVRTGTPEAPFTR